jgi:hypothetical protein
METKQGMVDSQEVESSLTEPSSKDIIDSWNRKKYASFQDYLNSEEYQEWKENFS